MAAGRPGLGWRVVPYVPLVLLALAATWRSSAPLVLVGLTAGFIVLRAAERPVPGAAWAGAIPVAVSLSWSLVQLPPGATDGSTCADLAAPFAVWRVAEAALTLGTVAVLVPLVGGGGGALGLRRPSRRVGAVALLAFLLAGPTGLVLGPWLAGPFFGPIGIDLTDPVAIVPASVFAVSNGLMEEIVYRGSLQAWTARSIGVPSGIVGQAIIFGLAHAAGPDVGGAPALLWAAMAGGGMVAGVLVWRTGSLAIPIAAHIGFDLPLYYGNACRI
jgi:membrane protease YdiL (CAAX protease family)